MSSFFSLKSFSIFIIFGSAISLMALGCSNVKKLQRDAGLRSRTIKLGDLGNDFKILKKTDRNPFQKQGSHPPIRIKYQTFKMKKLDQFFKRVNVLYGRYRVSKVLTKRYHHEVDQVLQTNLKRESRQTLKRSLKGRNIKDRGVLKRLSGAYDALKLSLTSTRGLTGEAQRLIEAREGIVSDSTSRLKKDLKKSILLDQVYAESKQSLKRLTEVAQGTPKLIKSLKRGLEIAQLAQEARNAIR